jgi:hypothetical protein
VSGPSYVGFAGAAVGLDRCVGGSGGGEGGSGEEKEAAGVGMCTSQAVTTEWGRAARLRLQHLLGQAETPRGLEQRTEGEGTGGSGRGKGCWGSGSEEQRAELFPESFPSALLRVSAASTGRGRLSMAMRTAPANRVRGQHRANIFAAGGVDNYRTDLVTLVHT